MSLLSANVKSGNIGIDVRNDIQRRKAWVDIISECENFFSTHSPYEIVYNTELKTGNVNYQKETVELSFRIEIKPSSGFDIVHDIFNGLKSTGKKYEWQLGGWPVTSKVFANWKVDGGQVYYFDRGKKTNIIVSLLTQNNKIIATKSHTILNRVKGNTGDWLNSILDIRKFTTETFKGDFVFTDVKADDITDILTIRFDSVDGINLIENNDYIKITSTNKKIK